MIPVLIVVVLGLVTARTILALQKEEPPANSLLVTAVGHQWWWEFEYPQYGFVTANELHVPSAIPETRGPPSWLQSQDVIHSFWVPQLAGKTDLIPNRDQPPVDRAPRDRPLRGPVRGVLRHPARQHAAARRGGAARGVRAPGSGAAAAGRDDPSEAAAGRAIFERTACINCHTVRGTVADGRFGPDLTHLMSRATLGAGVAPTTRDNLRDWIARSRST